MRITKVTNRNITFSTPENAAYDVVLGLILGKRHNFIIDTGMGGNNVTMIIEYIGNDAKPIIAINTHSHVDHILGNWVLENHTIISHILCREIIDKEWDGKIKKDMDRVKEYIDGEVHKCLPNLVFGNSIGFPEDGITIFHSPFHTEDCISVYDSVNKVLYTGDNFGIIDGKAILWGKDLHVCQSLIETYKKFDFDICIPAHTVRGSIEPLPSKNIITLLETALSEAQKKPS